VGNINSDTTAIDITPFSRTGKMPVPQRMNLIVSWAEISPKNKLEILIIRRWGHRTRLVDKQIFGTIILIDTIDIRLTFQGTGEAKCIHPIFALAHLVLADEFSLL